MSFIDFLICTAFFGTMATKPKWVAYLLTYGRPERIETKRLEFLAGFAGFFLIILLTQQLGHALGL